MQYIQIRTIHPLFLYIPILVHTYKYMQYISYIPVHTSYNIGNQYRSVLTNTYQYRHIETNTYQYVQHISLHTKHANKTSHQYIPYIPMHTINPIQLNTYK